MPLIGGVCRQRNSGERGDIRLYFRGKEISHVDQQKKVISFAEKIKKKQTEMAATISPVSVEVDTRPLSVFDAFLRGERS